MQLIVGHDIAVAEWVARRIGVAAMVPPYTTLGFIDPDGRLKLGFVFYGCVAHGNIDMAVAASGLLTRGILRAVAHYAFVQLQATRITCRPPTDHKRAIEILKRAGFKPEAVCKDWNGAGGDALQMRIRKTEAKRWMP